MNNNVDKPKRTKEEIDEIWNRIMEGQMKIAYTPVNQEEINRFHREISTLSPSDLLKRFTI